MCRFWSWLLAIGLNVMGRRSGCGDWRCPRAALTKRLIAQFGEENVADEHATGRGKLIDVVVRHSAGAYSGCHDQENHSPACEHSTA